MKLLKTHRELEEVLSRPEYTFKMPERVYIKEFEDCNSASPWSALTLFDDTLANMGRYPTPEEYIDGVVQLTKAHWYADSPEGKFYPNQSQGRGYSTNYLQWNEEMEKAVRWRAGRTYRSLIAEQSAMLHIKDLYPNSIILMGDLMDMVAGVDITVLDRDTDSTFHVHVTKDSPWAETNIKNKLGRTSGRYGIGGRYYPWKREWNESHIIVGYDDNPLPAFLRDNSTQSSSNVNGHIVFREEYIKELTRPKTTNNPETFSDNGAIRFDKYLKQYRINEFGAGEMIIYDSGEANYVTM